MIQVYTGNGKGKTTAAWGQAMRAVGDGLRVAIVQFLKTPVSGERKAASRLSPELAVFGDTRPHDPSVDQRESAEVRDDSQRNFDLARSLIVSGEWDLVVLDEINMVLYYGFVGREEMLGLLGSLPEGLEVICTGRYAPDWLIGAADLVTEMVPVKHPYDRGIGARKGIEF